MAYADDRATCLHPAAELQTKCFRCGQVWPPPAQAMPEPPPPLDLDEQYLTEALTCDAAEMEQTGHDDWALTVRELVARVRALEAEVARLRERAG